MKLTTHEYQNEYQREYHSGPIVWAGIISSTCLVLFLFQKILWLVVPFILALIIYYVLLPLKLRLVLEGLSHDISAAIVAGWSFGLMIVFFIITLPQITVEAVLWQDSAMRYVEGGLHLLTTTLHQLEKKVGVLAQAHLTDEVTKRISEHSDRFVQKHLPAIVLATGAWAPSLLLAPFLAFFMLRDGWRFRRFLGGAVPNAFFERTLYLLDQVDKTARAYFLGLLKLTMLDTLCLACGLWLQGVSNPLLLGLITAILAWIPFIGSVMGCLLVVLVAATDFPANPSMAYGAVVVFIVVRLLDDFIFMPMTIGKSLNMHPLLTVLMIFIGGSVAGVPGLMMVLPVLGIIMVLGETIGRVITDPRLRARHAHAKALREREVTSDLHLL